MLIVTRYFTREFLRNFLLCMASFVALYLLVDLFDRMDDMIKRQVSPGLMIQYAVCLVPMILHQVCPLGVLLCTFITLGTFVRNHEITALKAGGVSLFRVLIVFVLAACTLSLLSLWMQEYVLPHTNSRAKLIKTVHIKGKRLTRLYKKHQYWYRVKNKIFHVEFFNPEKNELQNVSVLFVNDDLFLKKRVDAERAQWEDGMWILTNGSVREFFPDGRMEAEAFTSRRLNIQHTPDDFRMSRKEGDEMSFSELRRFIAKIKKAGYPSTGFVVDLHAKVSYSFINIIMAILGIPFALRIGRSGGMAVGIGLSVVLGLVYWTFFGFCLSLGKGGAISPFVSAWIANIAFGALGLYLFLHVRQ